MHEVMFQLSDRDTGKPSCILINPVARLVQVSEEGTTEPKLTAIKSITLGRLDLEAYEMPSHQPYTTIAFSEAAAKHPPPTVQDASL